MDNSWLVPLHFLNLLSSASFYLSSRVTACVVKQSRSARFLFTEEMGLVTSHLHLQAIYHPNITFYIITHEVHHISFFFTHATGL